MSGSPDQLMEPIKLIGMPTEANPVDHGAALFKPRRTAWRSTALIHQSQNAVARRLRGDTDVFTEERVWGKELPPLESV